MTEKWRKAGGGVILGLAVVNLVWLDVNFWQNQNRGKEGEELRENLPTPTGRALGLMVTEAVPTTAEEVGCPAACQEKWREELATVAARPVVAEVKATAAPKAKTAYLSLGGGGETVSREWVEVPGSDFSFDLADYVSPWVYLQTNLKSEYGNSRCFVRLYDLSNLRAVDFSEQTTDQTGFVSLTSLALKIWRGNNNYELQIKSLNGIRCFLESPRLKIVSF